jgi:hypothetical protein
MTARRRPVMRAGLGSGNDSASRARIRQRRCGGELRRAAALRRVAAAAAAAALTASGSGAAAVAAASGGGAAAPPLRLDGPGGSATGRLGHSCARPVGELHRGRPRRLQQFPVDPRRLQVLPHLRGPPHASLLAVNQSSSPSPVFIPSHCHLAANAG